VGGGVFFGKDRRGKLPGIHNSRKGTNQKSLDRFHHASVTSAKLVDEFKGEGEANAGKKRDV